MYQVVDWVLVSSMIGNRLPAHLLLPNRPNVTLYLTSADAALISLRYQRFGYLSEPMYRSAVIQLATPIKRRATEDRPAMHLRFAQIVAVSGIASEVAKLLGPLNVPSSALRDHEIYVLWAGKVELRELDDLEQIPLLRSLSQDS